MAKGGGGEAGQGNKDDEDEELSAEGPPEEHGDLSHGIKPDEGQRGTTEGGRKKHKKDKKRKEEKHLKKNKSKKDNKHKKGAIDEDERDYMEDTKPPLIPDDLNEPQIVDEQPNIVEAPDGLGDEEDDELGAIKNRRRPKRGRLGQVEDDDVGEFEDKRQRTGDY